MVQSTGLRERGASRTQLAEFDFAECKCGLDYLPSEWLRSEPFPERIVRMFSLLLVAEADSEDDSPVCTPDLRQGSLGVQNAESLTIQVLDCGKNIAAVDDDVAVGVWFGFIACQAPGQP